MVEHAFYEAITHAQNRILYGNPVTDFAHVRANFVDSYARLVAMKLFSQRSVDYFRSASLDDRRYLLFNPMTKAKVTMEGETILRSLHDVVAAKGYEKNTMFREVAQLIGTLPRLEGTVHVNVGLVLKFMPNYMLNPKDYPEIPTRNDAADDVFFWNQGPTRGAGKVQFADWTPVYEKHASIPNVARFYEQAQAFKQLLVTAAPDAEQQKDLDFLLNVGHLFSLIVYGQLILEQAALTGVDDDIVDQIFDFQIRDFSTYAVALHGKPSSTQAQQDWAVGAIRKPVPDAAAIRPGVGARQGLRRRLRDASLTPHTGDGRARQPPGAGMAGQPVAVDHDVELEVQPHRLGHRLLPRNPLCCNGDIAQRDCLALAGCRAHQSARVVGERVADLQGSDGCLDRHIPVADQVHTVPLRSYSNSSSTASATRGP